jgi:hypothetical protein
MKRYLNLMIGLVAVCLCFGAATAQAKMAVDLSKLAKVETAFTTTAPMNVDGWLNTIIVTPEGGDLMGTVNMAQGTLGTGSKLPSKAPSALAVIPKASKNGEALLVFLLGGAGKAGDIVKAYAVATISYTQDGQDKMALVAVAANSKFHKVNNLEELNADFAGTADSLAKWLASFPATTVGATGSRLDALHLAGDSILEYGFATITEADRRPLDKDGNPQLLEWPTSKNLREEKI